LHRSRYHSRNSVLALSSSFMPMAEISRRKAIKAVVTGKALTVNPKTMVTSPNLEPGMPIKMIIYRMVTKAVGEPKLHSSDRGFRAILRRDGYKCGYCGCKLKPSASEHPHRATVDHILPRVQGGTSTFLNLVACCWQCNQTKRGRTPEQAGMKLAFKPQSPTAILLEKMHHIIESSQDN